MWTFLQFPLPPRLLSRAPITTRIVAYTQFHLEFHLTFSLWSRFYIPDYVELSPQNGCGNNGPPIEGFDALCSPQRLHKKNQDRSDMSSLTSMCEKYLLPTRNYGIWVSTLTRRRQRFPICLSSPEWRPHAPLLWLLDFVAALILRPPPTDPAPYVASHPPLVTLRPSTYRCMLS